MTPSGTVAQDIQELIASATELASIANARSVLLYNAAVANYQQNLGNLQAMGLPIPAPPVPPMLLFVDSNAITNTEENFITGPTQPSFFTQVRYVPVAPVPNPPASLSIQGPVATYPGFYEVNGDGPNVPVGSSFDNNGHTYKKVVVSYSPFAPNGQVTLWQQIL